MAPASLASSTSRGSTSASRRTSSGDSGLPSSTPPLITSSGLVREKSRRPRAASTGSPLMNAIAVGPVSSSSGTGNCACRAASLVSVFFTTAYVAASASERRSWVSCALLSPRYSVSTAPDEPWNRSAIAVTAATFSWLAMCLLSRASGRCRPGPENERRPGAGRTGRATACRAAVAPSVLRGSPVSGRDLRLGAPSGRRSSVELPRTIQASAGWFEPAVRREPGARSGRSPPGTAAPPAAPRRAPGPAPRTRAAPAGWRCSRPPSQLPSAAKVRCSTAVVPVTPADDSVR